MIGVNTVREQNVYGGRGITQKPSLLDVFEASFKEGLEYTTSRSIYKLARNVNAQMDNTAVPAAQLNKEYGIEGIIEFKYDTTVENAIALREEGLKRHILREIAAEGTEGRRILGTGIALVSSMIAQFTDFADIALAFLPVVGPAKISGSVAKTGAMKFIQNGIVKRESISNIVGGSKNLTNFVSGVVDGSVGNAMVEPFVYYAERSSQMEYGAGDSAINIIAGGLLGGLLQTGAGIAFLNRMEAGIQSSTMQAKNDAFRAALSETIHDEDITAAGVAMATDKKFLNKIISRYSEENGVELDQRTIDEWTTYIQDKIKKDFVEQETRKLDEQPFDVKVEQKPIVNKPKRKKQDIKTFQPMDEVEARLQSQVDEYEAEIMADAGEGSTIDNEVDWFNSMLNETEERVVIPDMDRTEAITRGVEAAVDCVTGALV